MERRKTSKILCACLLAAAVTAGGLCITWPTSDRENSKEQLKIEYVKREELADPPAISYETGVIERTHDIQVNAFTYEQAHALLKVALAESANQGEDGMWLVLSTILNRKNDEAWPETILGVIYESHKTKDGRRIYQFETVANGTIDKVEVSPEAHEALARIEMGEVAPEVIAFETKDSDALEQYFMPAFDYKDHRFYTKK